MKLSKHPTQVFIPFVIRNSTKLHERHLTNGLPEKFLFWLEERRMQKLVATSMAALLISSQLAGPVAAQAQRDRDTATPIKHLVVIFGENISFDHYFGTYPNALNPGHEPKFVAAPNTPTVNGYTDALLFNNPNLLNTTGNGNGATNPFRLDRSQAATADQDHDY